MLLISIAGQVNKIKNDPTKKKYQDFFQLFSIYTNEQLDPKGGRKNSAAWKTIYKVDNSPSIYNPESVFDIITQNY